MHALEKFLISRGLTQEAFAELIGSTQESVSRYISGERTPRRDVMVRIIAATDGDVTANDFLPRDASPGASGRLAAGESLAPTNDDAEAEATTCS